MSDRIPRNSGQSTSLSGHTSPGIVTGTPFRVARFHWILAGARFLAPSSHGPCARILQDCGEGTILIAKTEWDWQAHDAECPKTAQTAKDYGVNKV